VLELFLQPCLGEINSAILKFLLHSCQPPELVHFVCQWSHTSHDDQGKKWFKLVICNSTNFHSDLIPSKTKGDFVDTDIDTFYKSLMRKEGNFKNWVFQTLATQWHQNSDYLAYSLFTEHVQLFHEKLWQEKLKQNDLLRTYIFILNEGSWPVASQDVPLPYVACSVVFIFRCKKDPHITELSLSQSHPIKLAAVRVCVWKRGALIQP